MEKTRLTPWLIFIACLAPLVAAIVAYVWWPPHTRNNYGLLVEPQRPLPALHTTTLQGHPFDLKMLKGKWIMLTAYPGHCDVICSTKLYAMRQVRAATADKQTRIERVWLVTDSAPVDAQQLTEHPGLIVLRAESKWVETFLPNVPSASPTTSIYLIDPLGNLMLQWPANADMKKMRKDLGRLLWASRIG